MPPKGKGTSQPAKPAARYRRGKAIAQVESDSDSDAESPVEALENDEDEEEKPVVQQRAKEEGGKMRIGLRAVEVDDKGVVRVDGRAESGRTAREIEGDDAEERTSHIQLLSPKPRLIQFSLSPA